MISIKNLTKSYGDLSVICNLSLEIDGGVLGIVAPKGSGKTSLLNIMAGITAPSSGEILIDGNIITNDTKRKIGYLQEGTPLYLDMTPYEYLSFYGSAKKISSEKLYRQIDEVFELLALDKVKNVLIENISASDRQKLGLASTLLGNPATVLLDELFDNMTFTEVSATKSVIKMIGLIKTVVLTSSDLSPIADICDKVLILSPNGFTLLESAEEIATALRDLVSSDSEMIEESEGSDEAEGSDEEEANE